MHVSHHAKEPLHSSKNSGFPPQTHGKKITNTLSTVYLFMLKSYMQKIKVVRDIRQHSYKCKIVHSAPAYQKRRV